MSSPNNPPMPGRWLVLGVFLLSTTINYLDRQTLANVAPHILKEFNLSAQQYGWIVAAFSLTYAFGAPPAGLMIDRLGLTGGISVAIGLWSLAGIATGLGTGMASLVFCRAILGMAEAGGIPATGKAIRMYLPPAERALGTSLNQAALSLGLVLAPPVATWIASNWGWRYAFLVTGALGLVWLPVWRAVARPESEGSTSLPIDWAFAREPLVWWFGVASAVSLILQSFWANFTFLYLTGPVHATAKEAAWLATIPPVVATLGGLTGGAASFRLIRRGAHPLAARMRVCRAAGLIALISAFIPGAPTAFWATIGISVGLFAVSAFSVNMYAIPLDVYPVERAAFAISLLTFCYGIMQAVISPLFGAVIDAFGYDPISMCAAVSPLAAWWTLRRKAPQP